MKLVFLILALVIIAPCAIAQEKTGTQQIVKIGDIDKAPFVRLDFQLKGASCVSCIRRISKRLRGSKGVLKADISILSPYEGVVVFEGKKTNLTKIETEIKSEDKRASVTELQLTALEAVPPLVLPRSKTP